jgi:alpha-galactosidase
LIAHGVYASDRSEAVVSVARVTTALSLTPPPLLLPGLDHDATYRIETLPLPGRRPIGPNRELPDWFTGGADLSGRALASIGLQLPALHPETACCSTSDDADPPRSGRALEPGPTHHHQETP